MDPVRTIQIKTAPAYDVRIFEASYAREDEYGPQVNPYLPAAEAAKEVAAFLGVSEEAAADCTASESSNASALPRIFLLTDETVNELYGDTFLDALGPLKQDSVRFIVPPGETSKSLDNFGCGLEQLAKNGFTRSDVLIALGGGVIGDLGGFLAATYLRGIRCIQVPTTLLACVDSSVGGKTAIDLAAGKNLAGAFHQPALVVIHEGFLYTLSEEILLDGLAEAIKCGVIGDASLLEDLESLLTGTTGHTDPAVWKRLRSPKMLTRVITAAIGLKQKLVEEDERDTGARQLLNFGHTIGHAIEGASDYEVTHGHAVASGMYLCAKAVSALGWSEEDLGTRLGGLLFALGYRLVYPYDAETLYTYTMKDKKRSADTINLVIPVRAGRCELKKLPVADLKGFLKTALS
ncbi:MAG: 3-dehydroquinate synthase [Clostridiales bacterium]|nr:3-dehydroquinate synthase [Clostridiales bacterium]